MEPTTEYKPEFGPIILRLAFGLSAITVGAVGAAAPTDKDSLGNEKPKSTFQKLIYTSAIVLGIGLTGLYSFQLYKAFKNKGKQQYANGNFAEDEEL
jgi:membrane-bound ClpP family serine protease